MPASKPEGLIARHDTKATRKRRRKAAASVRPKQQLPQKPPAVLTGHPVASKLWRKMIRMYGQLEAEIVSLLDQDMLTDYCLLEEQVQDLDRMRAEARTAWQRARSTFTRKSKKKSTPLKELIKFQVAVNMAFNNIVKLDARADLKRKLLLALRQSLYLTPRSRAGFVPPEKPPEKPKSPMGALIDDVNDFLNQPSPPPPGSNV